MESPMGGSFGDVEVHTGAQAASTCEDINAKAFTIGNHIAFNSGEYDPSSAEGQHVIAHEVAAHETVDWRCCLDAAQRRCGTGD